MLKNKVLPWAKKTTGKYASYTSAEWSNIPYCQTGPRLVQEKFHIILTQGSLAPSFSKFESNRVWDMVLLGIEVPLCIPFKCGGG